MNCTENNNVRHILESFAYSYRIGHPVDNIYPPDDYGFNVAGSPLSEFSFPRFEGCASR